jgi:hypothetical protein
MRYLFALVAIGLPFPRAVAASRFRTLNLSVAMRFSGGYRLFSNSGARLASSSSFWTDKDDPGPRRYLAAIQGSVSEVRDQKSEVGGRMAELEAENRALSERLEALERKPGM